MTVPERTTLGQKLLVFMRSSLVGLGAVVLDIGSLALMVRVFGWSPEVANVPSLFLGMVWMFVGNKFFAFNDRSRDLLRQGGKFFVIEAIALGLNILIFHLLVTLTPLADYAEVARLIGTNVTYVCFSYPLWWLFVFRYRAAAQPQPAAVEAD